MTTQHLPAAAAGQQQLASDLRVNRIGYGAMKLTGWPEGDPRPDRDTALRVLRDAVELGVNHIDTCHYYSKDGVSANELIHAALHPYPDDLVIVTKVGPTEAGADDLKPGERTGLRPDGLRRAIEANLRTLGVDRLDLVNLRMDVAVTPNEGSMALALETLAEMQSEGLIRHLGISNVPRVRFAEAMGITPIACVQNNYSAGQRKHDALVDECAELGVAFVPFYPVSGFDQDTVNRLATVAARHDATVPQVALAWLLARSPSILLIPGTGSPSHLAENVAAGSIRLSADDLAELA